MLPASFIQSIQHAKGFNQTSFELVHTANQSLTSIRINPLKQITPLSMIASAKKVSWCEWGYYLAQRPSFTLDPQLHAGCYYVQEASSMFLWHILKNTIPITHQKKVLDVCAAPGGKTTLLASYFNDGLIVSNEVIKSRANILVENVTKWGADNVVVTNNDPAQFKNLENYFDVIVVDAPCSGSGLFRKDKDAINEWSIENVMLCNKRQQRIVADVIPALQTNGILIYSTCSYSKEENENMVDWMMETFNLISIPIPIDETWGIVVSESDTHFGKSYRFYPDKVEGEGFFVAVLQKTKEASKVKYKQLALQTPTTQEIQALQQVCVLGNTFTLFKHDTQIRAINQLFKQELCTIAANLYIKKAGICLGVIKGKDWVPHHELATSTIQLNTLPCLSLSKSDALDYLRKKEILVEASSGWTIVKYNEARLGWLKVLSNRNNNYYPSEWKINNL